VSTASLLHQAKERPPSGVLLFRPHRALDHGRSSTRSTILLAAVPVLVITCLNAGPRAVAAELAGRPVVLTHSAIALRDNDLPILNSKTIGVYVR
jgi:hypothetical protein